MDSFFGIGAPELVVILLLAGLVMGPHRIRTVALWLGKTTAQLQNISRGFARQLNAELSAVDEGNEMKDAWSEVQDLRRQIAEMKFDLTSAVMQPATDGKKAIQEAKTAIDNTIKLPQLDQTDEQDMKKSAPANPSENGASAALPKPIEVDDDPE